LDSIHQLLTVAGQLLDLAAREIRDAKLEPTSGNIENVGRALSEIFEIEDRIYAVRPDLAPAYLSEPRSNSDANQLLTQIMFHASEFERAGDFDGAIAEFEKFLIPESSPLHREIAESEIARLRNAPRP